MALFGFGAPAPRNLDELKSIFSEVYSRGDRPKAARIAKAFAQRAKDDSSLSDEERYCRMALGFSMVARVAHADIIEKKSPGYELLRAFFFAHIVAHWCFQKFLRSGLFEWNENHPYFREFETLNELYDDLYARFPTELLSPPDTEANQMFAEMMR